MPTSYAAKRIRFQSESDISYSINYEKLQYWMPALIESFTGVELECNENDLEMEEY